MNSFEGMGKFGRAWSDFCKDEFRKKLAEMDAAGVFDKMIEKQLERAKNEEERKRLRSEARRKAILSPKGIFQTMIDFDTPAFFGSFAAICETNKTSVIMSSQLVDIEYADFNEDILDLIAEEDIPDKKHRKKGHKVTPKEYKNITQRFQTRQLTTMRALEAFGLVKVHVNHGKGKLNNTLNSYELTQKGRDVMVQLIGEDQ